MTRRSKQDREAGRALPKPGTVPPANEAGPCREASPSGLTAHRERTADLSLRAAVARLNGGLSPHAFVEAWADWGLNLARAPGRQLELARHAQENSLKLMAYMMNPDEAAAPPFSPKESDHRFDHPSWSKLPFRAWQQGFLAMQDWWEHATTPMRGLERKNAQRVQFAARQALDLLSPSNLPWTDPELLEETVRKGGSNITTGAAELARDLVRTFGRHREPLPPTPRIGLDLACTPGKVIYRNDLMELIQYAPATGQVRPEPILIVPAWIMKYYILDLSPENSMVRHLVDQGFTVFMISWVNPAPAQAELSLEDYRKRGAGEALEVIGDIVANAPVHAVGYCLGGMMLALTAATMARDGDRRLASVTLLAAQLDFADAGELQLFLDESQVACLEDMMWDEGVLDRPQMARRFAATRAGDLICSRVVRRYFLGREDLPPDMETWIADITRMPARMHSEYLRGLVLENRLTSGRFAVEGRTIALADIEAPMFVVAAAADHIAPWQSVYKTQLFTGCDLTFVLTTGGHNSGIVCDPASQGHHYRMSRRPPGMAYVGPAGWQDAVRSRPGFWWREWFAWLAAQSGTPVSPPEPAAAGRGLSPGDDAPGTYIHQL